MGTPTKEQGLQALLGHREGLSPVLDTLASIEDDLDDLVGKLPKKASVSGLSDVRDSVLSRFTKSRVADMLGSYTINRREQVNTLMKLGKEPMLELISQGAMPTELSRDLNVSHRLLIEFLERICSPEELRSALDRGTRMVIFQSADAIGSAYDKDDVVKAKTALEANLKFIKAYTQQFEAQPASTSIEVNNNVNGSNKAPFLQVVSLPDKEDLPMLKGHSHIADDVEEFVPDHIEDGVFQLIPTEENEP